MSQATFPAGGDLGVLSEYFSSHEKCRNRGITALIEKALCLKIAQVFIFKAKQSSAQSSQ